MEAPSREIIKELQAATIIDVPHPAGGVQPLAILNVANVPDEDRIRNVQKNIKRDLIRFAQLPRHIARNEPIAIVGGGPSVAKNLEKIKGFKQIWSCGSSHDYLVENGITPTFALACDAMEEQAFHFRKPQEKTTFIIASQCSPKLFEQLKGHKIALWHFRGQIPEEHFNGEETLGWGCMVTIISILLALQMGFQEMHFFGVDCCLDEEKTHAYDVPKDEIDWMRRISGPVYVGELKKKFISTNGLMLQCDEFFRVFSSGNGKYLKGYVYGDGMIAEVIRQSPPEMKQWLEVA